VIKTADWLIDLGPEGGTGGGGIVSQGTPETVAACADSHTGRFLAPMLGVQPVPKSGAQGAGKKQKVGPSSAPKARPVAGKTAAAKRPAGATPRPRAKKA